ncbi:MAG: class I SAM-dependent methyltransferase [Ktedonobacterales bacterium]
MQTNAYTRLWFDTFLRDYDEGRTQPEVAFLERNLPWPEYRTVLDVCCGLGRHALPLAERGYAVTGVDRDAVSVAEAQRRAETRGAGRARFVVGDMRALAATVPGTFDAVLCLWASFGYFDAATNAAVLWQMAAKLRPHGRLLLDVYHREFFAAIPPEETAERAGERIKTTRTLVGNRLTSRIAYGRAGTAEAMEWQLYPPEELCALAAERGLRALAQAAAFVEGREPSAATPRVQYVFEKL